MDVQPKVFRRALGMLLDMADYDKMNQLLRPIMKNGTIIQVGNFLKEYFNTPDPPPLEIEMLLSFLKAIARRGSKYIKPLATCDQMVAALNLIDRVQNLSPEGTRTLKTLLFIFSAWETAQRRVTCTQIVPVEPASPEQPSRDRTPEPGEEK